MEVDDQVRSGHINTEDTEKGIWKMYEEPKEVQGIQSEITMTILGKIMNRGEQEDIVEKYKNKSD